MISDPERDLTLEAFELPRTQHELGARLRLEKSTVGRPVGLLGGRGWLERQPNPADGRSVSLWLTGAGARTAGQIAAARHPRRA